MVLHLIKDPSQPLAKQVLASGRSSLVAALLNPAQAIPQTTNGVIYTVTSHEPNVKQRNIDYYQLLDLIFEAERVIVL